MGVKLEDLMAELSPQDVRDVNARTRKHVKAIEEASRLDAVRKALGRTQQEVAARMGIGQNAVSQLESRDDVRLSTLHKFVEGMGLHLELALVGSSGQRVVLKNYRPWEATKPPGSAKKSAKLARAKAVPARPKQAGAATRRAPRKADARENAVASKSPERGR
jgi:transcriptional regulator with XRE-family HTH domain